MRRNYRKVIKNWKVVRNGLDSVTAFNMFKAQAIQGIGYDLLAIRLHGKVYQPGIVDTDDGMEESLSKMRQMYKDEHFTRLTHEKIDNMSISDLYHALIDVMNSLDDRNKYRLAKHIIENKLYKKQ